MITTSSAPGNLDGERRRRQELPEVLFDRQRATVGDTEFRQRVNQEQPHGGPLSRRPVSRAIARHGHATRRSQAAASAA
ncbi:hypothetical protein [Streptosporangium roseum]|uniref:Uncharacterized protein n=1 Tax=Streptosporangium roseum (strain ATCC 12428 / DSM 43021 / JCM 3005 / KCTC 9067 / NCIMB 10171 / NRRL 2505 / NI 9100) TaxID=479432 RepID=D2B1N2_STRRD|nr:hypothetical protein [Streptosporangium roseum]ACZ87334.1 hypothetical protein Sros_4467 [Streptosporangium roseum DSM 43021]